MGTGRAGAGGKRGSSTEMKLCAGADDESGSYGTVNAKGWSNPRQWLQDAARWLETSDSTDPGQIISMCCDDFKPRKLKAPFVLLWLAFQVIGILFQSVLFREVTRHLSEYEDTLTQNCGPQHRQQGVCLGPTWNLSASATLMFPAQGNGDGEFDFVIPPDTTFSFETRSSPPTFLVAVEPQPPHEKATWRLSITPAKDTARFYSTHEVSPITGSGNKFKVVVLRGRKGSSRSWKGTLNLKSKYDEPAQVHAYVVDSRIQHLEDIHGQKQCSFEDSWQNFNERHSGEFHRVLTNSQSATAFFLLLSIASTAVVMHRFWYFIEGGKLLSRVIILKFVLQDLPQQMCIVAYLYGWYARNGLRCQMCLFHPHHCDDEEPLHWTNLMVCLCTLLSASSNQLLFQAKHRKYDEEEECCMWLMRGALFSVSALPFCTAMFFLSTSLLNTHSLLIYIVSGVPTLLGWFSCCCVPLFTMCDEDYDGWDI